MRNFTRRRFLASSAAMLASASYNRAADSPNEKIRVAIMGCRIRGSWTGSFLVVELTSAGDVRALRPDLAAIAARCPHGLIVTAAADVGGVDIVSRVFAPAIGIPEDPVTGAAHCQLAPLWSARLGRGELVAEQASSRGGTLRLRVAGDRVIVTGQAVTVWEGTLLV